MTTDASNTEAGPAGLASRIITGWALAGGVVLMMVVFMNTWSVAAFAFLPYCQLTGANVSADIFTSGASARWVAIFSLVGSLVAFGFSLLLLWRMWAGMLDQKEYGYTTAILQVPHWIVFIPILVSLGLLAVAAAITLSDEARRARRH